MKEPADDNKKPVEEPVAPAKLIEALRGLQGAKVSVPVEVDEAVLAAARSHLQRTARAHVIPFPRWLAAAAAVVAAAGLLFLLSRTGRPGPALAREDVDRNGRVDILDAFALARKLQAGPIEDLLLDLNGDGRIDQRDVDSIAAQAVKLHNG